MNIKRGDIFYADLSPVIGSEQGGIRPVLIVQNDVGNRFSPYSGGHHKSAVKGKSAHTHSAQCRFFGTCQRQRCFA